MGLPIIGGLIRGAGALAKAGVIRGTAGRILGGGARSLPRTLPGGAIVGASGGKLGKILRGGGAAVAGGAAFEAGGRIMNGVFGEKKKRRRPNYANSRALARALRRVEGFEKLVKRAFVVRDIKPRKKTRCR